MKDIDVDASYKFVRRLVGASYIAVVFVAALLLVGGGGSDTGFMVFAASAFVAFALWTAELTNAFRAIRWWTWGLTAFWGLIVLIAYSRLTPLLTKIEHLHDAQMFIFVFLGFIGFPTSALLSVLLFYLSIWLLGTDYAGYFFNLQRTEVVVVIDTACLLLAAAIQWRAVAWWRRRRKRMDGM